MSEKLPKDGTVVEAKTVASEDNNRPSKKIRGKLKTRWVQLLQYTQTEVDGVQVEPDSIRAVEG